MGSSSLGVRRKRARERGQAAIFIAMSLVAVLGLTGLAVDLGYAYYRKQACKTAAQSAAIAGVKVTGTNSNFLCAGGASCQSATACPAVLDTPTNAVHAACLYAKKNGFTNDPVNGTQQVSVSASNSTPPVPGLTPTYWMSVTVSEQRPPWFGAILGLGGFKVSARSTAAYFLPSVGGCIYALEPSLVAVTTNGSPTLKSGCGLYVNSNNPAAISMTGNAKIIATNGSDVSIVGGWDTSGGASISPAPHLGVPPVSDPFAGMQPPPVDTCTNTGVALDNWQTATISPGVICGGINLSGQSSLTLQPGVYVVKGGITASGQTTITGNGVTIYLVDGSVTLTGGGGINLTAPTTGYWQGVLFFQDRNNASPATITGNASSTINGALYFPSAGLSLSGGGTYHPFSATLVSKTLRLVGNTFLSDPVTTKFTAGNAGTYIIE